MITIEQALEAIDNLDDYARMETGVDPIGPRECLISFVSQYEQLRAENDALITERDLNVRQANVYMDENRRLKAELAEAKKDADIFQWLQDNHVRAQAFFWNYSSRRQRRKAILEAMKGK